MLERLKHLWRLFMAAPAGPMTAKNFKTTLSKLSETDPATRDMLAGIGISPEMLRQPDFDPRKFLLNRNLTMALQKAFLSEEGGALLAKAGELAPDSEELGRVHAELLKRFGSPQIEKFLRSMPLQ